jgi:autophagy-related protein 9
MLSVQEAAMAKVCLHTHWVPLYWRGRAHTASVRSDFQGLFQLQAVLVAQELLSVVLLPWICAVTLPRCADDIAKFLRDVRTSTPLKRPTLFCW